MKNKNGVTYLLDGVEVSKAKFDAIMGVECIDDRSITEHENRLYNQDREYWNNDHMRFYDGT